MMITASQLEQLHKAAGGKQVVLPYRARLTPLAADWVRSGKVTIGYSDAGATAAAADKPAAASAEAGKSGGEFLWWCDGPCGPIKAAISMEAKQTPMRQFTPPAGGNSLVMVLKAIAQEVKADKSSGGVLAVETAGPAVVLANRSPVLRAVVGTSLSAVEQGVNVVAANVLILEHPRLSLAQARTLLLRFLRGARNLNEETKRHIAELSL
jgi:hypothetical protein